MEISFDLKTLRVFVLVAQDLNFTMVADRLNTVQSAISNQIRNLEAELGQTLISRGRGQKMCLTRQGETFLLYAQRILALAEDAAETVRTSDARHVLRLGTTVTLSMSLVAQVLGAFCAERPDVQIQIQCDRSDRLMRRLEDDEIDVAFMMDQGRHSLRSFVHSMDLSWVCAPGFDIAGADRIPLAFLTDGRDLRHYALDALDRAGRAGHVSHLSPHPIGVRSLVQAGLALTVMPAATVIAPLIIAPQALGLPKLPPIALAGYQGRQTEANGAAALLEKLDAACR